MKLTKRKQFKFYRSYFDVYNELSNKDKVIFMNALLDKQFLNIEPDNLTGIVKIAWLSLYHSIDTQVKGYESKTGNILNADIEEVSDPMQGAIQGAITPPKLQEEEEEKEKEKEKNNNKQYPDFFTENLISVYKEFLQFRKEKRAAITKTQEPRFLKKLENLSNKDPDKAKKILIYSIENGYQGIFELKKDNNEKPTKQKDQSTDWSSIRNT